MKPIEVFIKYIKIRDLMMFLKNKERNKVISVLDLKTWKLVNKDFKSFVNDYVCHNGFHGLFIELEYYFFGHDSAMNQGYEKASRLWSGFVKKNVFIKNSPKDGDSIEIMLGNMPTEYKFCRFIDEYRTVEVKDILGRAFFFNVDKIQTVNGEPYEMNFYIKWKGKVYGNN
jgi:hypothetical protein